MDDVSRLEAVSPEPDQGRRARAFAPDQGAAPRELVLWVWLSTQDRCTMMITFEDCLAFCGLTEAEILAIAEHEHIPEISAAGLGRYLLDSPGGPKRIREMILDDIACARQRGDTRHGQELAQVLKHFMKSHPEAGSAPLPTRRRSSTG